MPPGTPAWGWGDLRGPQKYLSLNFDLRQTNHNAQNGD